ncbi:hypothetical protein [Photobacterium carnosum]|uniref:hypothetical protein n=1 Tax=Photobacterium carnosum TaxID=2023717 RepID=UPI001C90043B|nr:hypothetical protein [Photobacterium carnosum]MBY3790029.1 DNA-binding protein [Photobacterium carnosum]MCD9528367.1 DNA-binding protein [Photobacterium carnosum]MCD9531641.1 DNA-binding protein [Photobacterium carnosum]MCD9535807.1 DNA-binding protein [Photobacterium carnosum]MCD9542745.1 DNA-binding protein [Photobacterium carnosum]
MDHCLRINDVIELTGFSRRSIYNAISADKLQFKTKVIRGSAVKLFSIDSVIEAFPKLSQAHKTILRQQQEIDRLKFANLELQKAIEALDPEKQIIMDKP